MSSPRRAVSSPAASGVVAVAPYQGLSFRPKPPCSEQSRAMAADDDKTLEVLKEIRDIQKNQLEQMSRFLWVLLPIFAALLA